MRTLDVIRLVRETTGCSAIPITTPLVPIATSKKPMGRWRKKRLNKKVKRSIWEAKQLTEENSDAPPEMEPYPDDYIDANGEPLIHHFKSFPQEMWFEYHCWEDPKSSDADLWYHSHQKCTVLGTLRSHSDFEAYKIRFKDGFVHEAGGDELFHSRRDFFRPDPPKKPKTLGESVSLDQFLKACKRALSKYADSDFASDQCRYVSAVVVLAARQVGLSPVMYSANVLGDWFDTGHSFVVINDTAIDFTLTQFFTHNDVKPWPFVARVGSEEFDSVYEDATADDSWDVGIEDYGETPEYIAIMKELRTMGESLADALLDLRDISMGPGTADQGEYFRGMANAMEVAACCVTGEEPQFVTEIEMELVEPCELNPEMYTGLRYGYCVEIDGKTYKTKSGVRCTRNHCGGPSRFRVSDDGRMFQIHIPAKYRPKQADRVESISKDFEQYGKPFKKVKTPEEIAKSHGSTVERVLAAIEKGIPVEREHTSDERAARTIATAHVAEMIDYYDKLGKMEHESLVLAMKSSLVETLLEKPHLPEGYDPDGDNDAGTSEADMESRMADMFREISDIGDVRTFEETGVMTRNKGLTIRLDDGSEFQITIVKSR